jgi:hypothetical protein
MMRRALQAALLVVAGVLAGGLMLEAGFRVLGWVQGIDHRLYLQDLVRSGRFAVGLWNAPEPGPLSTLAARAYRHYPPFKPNAQVLATTSDYSVAYVTNSKGLRDREYAYDKPSGVTRVLAFGDSFTFGSGVASDDRFTEVAEQALDRVEILNMGVLGYGLDQILLSFLAQGVKYHPDIVLVVLNASVTSRNTTGIVRGDAVHIPASLDAVVFKGESSDTAYLRADDPLWASGRPWIVRHSYILAFLTYRLQARRLHAQLEKEDEDYWRLHLRDSQSRPFSEDHGGVRRKRTIVLLRELRRAVEASGARLLVVNIDAQMAMIFLASEPGFDFVDFSRELHDRASTRSLTFTYDMHYNADTHRFLGWRLADELRKRLAPGTR